jgi:hypothetical protein
LLQAPPYVLFEIHQLNNTHVLPWHNFKCVLCSNVQFKAMNAMCWMLSNGLGTNLEPKLVTMQNKGLKLTHLTNGTYKFHKSLIVNLRITIYKIKPSLRINMFWKYSLYLNLRGFYFSKQYRHKPNDYF